MQQIMYLIFSYLLIYVTSSLQLYNHRTSILNNPNWMALLDNGIPLRKLSIIGSHSTMSQGTWGDAFQTQSNSLTKQMTMGMRALDIRCRHMNNQLKVYDRIIYLNTDLAGVLTTVRSYLQTYTMQVILMHIVSEGSPSGNSGTFQSAFLSYYNNFLDIIWTPTTQNPVLGEVRGKVVIIQDFTASAIYGLLYSTFTVLPHKTYSTNWDQYDKWLAVKSFLVSANAAGMSQLSFWTGNVGSFPYFVASGQSSPNNGDPRLATGLTTPGFKSSYPDFPRVACFIGICTIAFEGINILAFNYINSKSITYTGIVFTDFIGDDIITKSISMNMGKFVPCPTAQITQGCSYCSNTGQCLGCNTTLHYLYNSANFSCLAASGYYLFWTNATANTPTLCNIPMPGCLTCSSDNVCLTCDVLAHYQLQYGACIAAPGYYLNASSIPVVCTLVGCYQCLSATVCSNCSIVLNYILNNSTNLCECNSAEFFLQNTAIPACLCMVGYYLSPNNTCETIPVCPANNSGCLICNTAVPACNICDAVNHFITDINKPTVCTCQDGYFYDGNTCIACSLTLTDACLTCASQSLCLSCQTNFTLTNGNCVCQTQFYSYNTSTCLMCEVGCLRCTSATMCQVCDTANNFTMLNNLCECLPGMYLSGTVCVPCGAMPGCLTCTMSGCTSCDPVFGFSLNNASLCQCAFGYYINSMDVCAQCTQLGCLACDSLTNCTNCSAEFYLSSGVCLQVCGDGVLYTLPCDDGNLINGDGCSSTCQIENDYTCVGGSTTSASACSFSGSLSIKIVSMTKDPSANKVYLFATIQPALPQLSYLDFTTVFLPDFAVETTTTTYDPNSGSIAMTFTYNTSLNDAPLAVSFVPPATPSFFYMPVTKVGLPQVTNNNLALKVYSPEQYSSISKMEMATWAVSLGAVGIFLVCFFFVSKLMAIEMILIFQVAFAGLLLLQKLELFMVPLRNLKIVNGYNQLISGSQEGLPGRISQISYKTNFLSNFSMDLLIFALPLLVGAVLLIIGKIAKKKNIRVFSYKVLKEWFFSSLLFEQIHLGVCLFINLLYDNKSKMMGLAVAGIIQLCIIVVLIVFVKSPKNFGEYKDFFKEGSAKKNWYVIVSLIRTSICVVIGYFSNVDFCGYVAVGLASVLLLGQLIVRPYESNIRPFVNNLILIVVLSIYQYCKMIKNSTEVTISSTYIALFIIGLLVLALLFNLICMIVWKCQSWKSSQKKQFDQTLLSDASEQKNIDKQYVQKLKEQLKGIAINTKDISLQLEEDNGSLGSARRIKNIVKNSKKNTSFVEIQLSQTAQLSKKKAEEFYLSQDQE